MGAWVANSRTAVATASAHVESGILSGEGEKDGGAPCSVLSNLKWLTSQTVNQPSRAGACCCSATAAAAADHKPTLDVVLDHTILCKRC